MTENDTKKIRAVQTACRILNVLREVDSATVTEIANDLGLAASGIQYQLQTLCEEQLVVKEGTEYRLSLRFLDLAEQAKQYFDNFDVIQDEIDKLVTETGEVAQFATMEHSKAIYVYKAKGDQGVETASNVGYTGYLHSTALGKAILSELSDTEIDRVVDVVGLPEKTRKTITSRPDLEEELTAIRDRGYALDNEENVTGLRCIAVPVTGPGDKVLGAISVSGPSKRMADKRIHEELPEMLAQTANVIEINTKFS